MSHNITLFSERKRKNIELDKQASLLILNLKNGVIKRGDILLAIDKMEDSEKEYFKDALNKYKRMR